MKRFIQLVVAAVLLGSLTIQADPFKLWQWTDPIHYENGQIIPAGDLIENTLHCGIEAGGPYPASIQFDSQFSPSREDMDFVVSGNPGIYYCVSSVSSLEYGLRSGYSNEIDFSVAASVPDVAPELPVKTGSGCFGG